MNTDHPVLNAVSRQFQLSFGHPASHLGWAPGRVNLIGDHTDYQGGFALPMGLHLGVGIAAGVGAEPGLRLYASSYHETAQLTTWNSDVTRLPGWARYVAGVVVLSRQKGCPVDTLDLAIDGDLNQGSGLSSSAAISVATALVLQALTGWQQTAAETCLLCQEVEHRFAGVQCGIMDQMASRLCPASGAVLVDSRNIKASPVRMPPGQVEFLVVESGVSRSLSESGYNDRREESAQALAAIQDHGIEAEDLRGVNQKQLEPLLGKLPTLLYRRARHIVTENHRVLDTCRALQGGDFATAGELMTQSHKSLRDDYESSHPRVDQLAEWAQKARSVLGARITGGGFGGNVVVMVEPDATDRVADKLKHDCRQHFDHDPTVLKISTALPAWSGEAAGSGNA